MRYYEYFVKAAELAATQPEKAKELLRRQHLAQAKQE